MSKNADSSRKFIEKHKGKTDGDEKADSSEKTGGDKKPDSSEKTGGNGTGNKKNKDIEDEKEKRRLSILTEPLLPLLIRMALPTMLGMMVSLIYNLTDTFWIGRLNDKSMTAAIGVVYAFVSFIQAIGFWFGYGSGNTMSRLLGSGNEQEARAIASDGVVLSILSGLLIMALSLLFLDPLAATLGGNVSPALFGYTKDYLRIMLAVVPFSLLSTTVYNQLRLCGNAKDAIMGLMVGMLGNILLDPLFVLGLHMGIIGAGIATLIGNVLSCVCVLVLAGKHGNIPIQLRAFRLTGERLYHILAGGAPNFSRQGITSVASVLLNMVAAAYGETMLAALTVATRVASLGYMLMIGFGQGFQPICAMNYGAKKYDRVKKVLRLTAGIGTAFLTASSVLIAIFALPLCGLLSKNEEVVAAAGIIVRCQCISLPFLGVYALASMFLQNIGKYFHALLISVARQGLFYIPLLFLLPSCLGEWGLYILQPAADLLSVGMSALIVAASWKKIFQ